MTDIAHLLPCPFCGGRPQIDETEDGGSFIECAKCGASSAVHYGRMENLIPSWNRRELEADNERLRAALKPFAVASDSYDDDPPARVINSKRGSILSVYDLRAAKAALE